MRIQQQNGDEILDDENEETKQGGGDFGMDFLARSLGLDITALAVKLAMDADQNQPAPA